MRCTHIVWLIYSVQKKFMHPKTLYDLIFIQTQLLLESVREPQRMHHEMCVHIHILYHIMTCTSHMMPAIQTEVITLLHNTLHHFPLPVVQHLLEPAETTIGELQDSANCKLLW